MFLVVICVVLFFEVVCTNDLTSGQAEAAYKCVKERWANPSANKGCDWQHWTAMNQDCKLNENGLGNVLLPLVYLPRGTVPVGNCVEDCYVDGNKYCCRFFDVDVYA